MKLVRRILKWVAISIASLIALLLITLFIVTRPAILTSIINSYANDYLNADVNISKAELTLFSDYPNVSIKLDSTSIVSYALTDSKTDTLLSFSSLCASINISSLLNKNLIELGDITLNSPKISTTIDSNGKGSWEIYQIDDTVSEEDTTSGYGFKFSRILIDGSGGIKFNDLRDSIFISSELSLIDIKQTDAQSYYLAVDLSVDSCKIDSINYQPVIPIEVKGSTNFDLTKLLLDNTNFAININEIGIDINGEAEIMDSIVRSNLKINCNNLALAQGLDILPLINNTYRFDGIESNLSFDVSIATKGSLDYMNIPNGKLPEVTIDILSNGGNINFTQQQEKINRVLIDLTAHFNMDDNIENYVDIRALDIASNWFSLNVNAKVDGYMNSEDTRFKSKIKTSVKLGAINRWLPILGSKLWGFGKISLNGNIEGDIDINSSLSNLSISRLGLSTIGSNISFKDVTFNSDSMFLYINGRAGISSKKSLLLASTSFDSLTFNSEAFKANASGSGITFEAGILSTNGIIDTTNTQVIPVGGKIEARRFVFEEYATTDTLRFYSRNLWAKFEVKPIPTDPTVPQFIISTNASRMGFREGLNRFSLGSSSIKAVAIKLSSEEQIALRREHRLDSLQLIYPNIERDSLMAHNRRVNTQRSFTTRYGDIDLNPGRDIRSMLRKWSCDLNINSSSARITTPYLPLQTRLSDIDIDFNLDSLKINNISGTVGKSDIHIGGKVTNIKESLLGRGILSVNLLLNSNTIDFNEIIVALNAGSVAAANLEHLKESDHSDEVIEQHIANTIDSTNASMLILVPHNINIDASLRIKNAIYGNLELYKLVTEVSSRNSVLQLREFSSNTNIGKMKLHALYSTKSKDDIDLSAELELSNVNLGKLIDQIPEIDTLLPMLSSFEGTVDVNVAAKAKLDSSMNLVIPSLWAVASMSGSDLVLLDGETFTEISKMLRFKNKSRNVVDKASVELKVSNSKMELYPFVLEIDRYKTAVSGVHSLDMNFNYHISVIKSIIPFRVGLNIFGNLDDWDFKIVSSKYKNEKSIPSHSYEIDNIRINLRDEIINAFEKENSIIIKDWTTSGDSALANVTKSTIDSTGSHKSTSDSIIVGEFIKIVRTKDGYVKSDSIDINRDIKEDIIP